MLGTVVRYYFRPDRLQLLNGSRFSSWTGRGYPIAAGQPVEAAFDAGEVISKTDFVCGASLAISRPCVEAIGLMDEIGRASCRDRVCQIGWISVVAESLKKNKKQ